MTTRNSVPSKSPCGAARLFFPQRAKVWLLKMALRGILLIFDIRCENFKTSGRSQPCHKQWETIPILKWNQLNYFAFKSKKVESVRGGKKWKEKTNSIKKKNDQNKNIEGERGKFLIYQGQNFHSFCLQGLMKMN